MKKRTEIDAADLYVMMQRELRRRRRTDCEECFVQLPYRVDRKDPDWSNWDLILPQPCPRGCRELIDDLVEELSRRYDLKDDDSRES